jgi:hypothetical protein
MVGTGNALVGDGGMLHLTVGSGNSGRVATRRCWRAQKRAVR